MELELAATTRRRALHATPHRGRIRPIGCAAVALIWCLSALGCSGETTADRCPVCAEPGDPLSSDAVLGDTQAEDAAPAEGPETADWNQNLPGTREPDGDDSSTEQSDVSSQDSDAEEEILAGTFGAPCVNNSDCFSGWCVEGLEGFICTEGCGEACPEGYDCKGVAGTSDVAFLCMPRLQKRVVELNEVKTEEMQLLSVYCFRSVEDDG